MKARAARLRKPSRTSQHRQRWIPWPAYLGGRRPVGGPALLGRHHPVACCRRRGAAETPGTEAVLAVPSCSASSKLQNTCELAGLPTQQLSQAHLLVSLACLPLLYESMYFESCSDQQHSLKQWLLIILQTSQTICTEVHQCRNRGTSKYCSASTSKGWEEANLSLRVS